MIFGKYFVGQIFFIKNLKKTLVWEVKLDNKGVQNLRKLNNLIVYLTSVMPFYFFGEKLIFLTGKTIYV